MSDILSAVLEDMACDLGLIVQLPPPPTSPSLDSLSLAEPHSPFATSSTSSTPTPSRKRPLSPSSTLFTPPATPRTPQFLTPHSKRVRATSSSSPQSASSALPMTPVKDVDLLLLSLVRRSPRLHSPPSQSLSQLLTSGSGWQRGTRSAASTPNKPRGQSQQPRLPRPFLTPQPAERYREVQAVSSAAPMVHSEHRRHSDGARLSSKRYHAALSLHAPVLTDTSSMVVVGSGRLEARADHLEVPVVAVRRSPPTSPSHVRDSARSSKVLFGHGG